eukprot:TRINITY_DN2186_c0_g1_i6.p1 TRINITY_DN2186_c0_g1~~TRINITY_DN2186_c0_g1_i6.p1  ORF type:complete len:136 (-),score=12.02 TRINITY_DN2186_c0_g1_i6:20-427(-)
MKGFIVFLLLGLVFADRIVSENELDTYTFGQYCQDFDKSYMTRAEAILHSKLFIERLHIIKEHNKNSKSYKMGVNKFTDMTEAELSAFRGYDFALGARLASGNETNPCDAYVSIPEIGRAVQQECRDRSRMPSSA